MASSGNEKKGRKRFPFLMLVCGLLTKVEVHLTGYCTCPFFKSPQAFLKSTSIPLISSHLDKTWLFVDSSNSVSVLTV